ncbi:MAG: fimbrillin family protein [Rikenellaceae bacterium]|nr:fimbrillin family protein [Rikenellaceae bacterium]
MKRKTYLIASALMISSWISCHTEDPSSDTARELTLFPVVEQRNGTRLTSDKFFATGSQIEVNLTQMASDGTTTDLTYTYKYTADRIFEGVPGYVFPLDDSYISTLEAKWPRTVDRADGLKTDQRGLEDYLAADWISGGLSASQVNGIMPTDTPVPLVFSRENVLLDFELVGQNTTGLDIESLLIELQSTSGSEAYWAYCGNSNGHAELIVAPGSGILSEENYLIGRIRLAGQSIDYTIIFPQTDITFQKGYRYLITLTPQGYFMMAYVYIGGFQEAEEGIGIPFQQPSEEDSSFRIDTAAQLITMSYLMRHYNDGTTWVWTEQDYVISDSLMLTAEQAASYIPVPASLFSGTITNEQDVSVTTVNVAGGSSLQIFDPNN